MNRLPLETTHVGRTERDAPEIDNEVFVRSAVPLTVGDIVDVDIDDATEYDLFGTVHGEARAPATV